MDAGQDVEERAIVGGRKADPIGGHDGNAERTRQARQRREVSFFVAQQVPLQLDRDAGGARSRGFRPVDRRRIP